MDRSRFMRELEELLQGIPMEERESALQFYNDYFDEAGEENEQDVIREFGSPRKVADKIREDIHGESGKKASTAGYEVVDKAENGKKAPWNSGIVKILLIVAIVLVGLPVIVPVALGFICVVIGCLVAVAALFFALVIMAIAVAITGVVVFIAGGAAIIHNFAAGLAILGVGLILSALGAMATVVSVRLCLIVFPGIIRGFVWVCRRIFHGKAVVSQ